jgi:hypothetical protein
MGVHPTPNEGTPNCEHALPEGDLLVPPENSSSSSDQTMAAFPNITHVECEEEQALPEFDAPQPEAAVASASVAWKTLASTSLTKMKAAKFGRVDV